MLPIHAFRRSFSAAVPAASAVPSAFTIVTVTDAREKPSLHAVPVVKGQVSTNHPTVVSLKFQHPIIPALFLLIFPLMFVPPLVTANEITINGVLREPTMTERISFIVLSIGIPAVLYYTNFIRPLQKLHRDIKVKLKLEEKA